MATHKQAPEVLVCNEGTVFTFCPLTPQAKQWLDSSSPCYETMVSAMAFSAKLERDQLIERVTTGVRRARKEPGKPVLHKVAIAHAEGTLREVGKRFGCSAPYVLRCKREAGINV